MVVGTRKEINIRAVGGALCVISRPLPYPKTPGGGLIMCSSVKSAVELRTRRVYPRKMIATEIIKAKGYLDWAREMLG